MIVKATKIHPTRRRALGDGLSARRTRLARARGATATTGQGAQTASSISKLPDAHKPHQPTEGDPFFRVNITPLTAKTPIPKAKDQATAIAKAIFSERPPARAIGRLRLESTAPPQTSPRVL